MGRKYKKTARNRLKTEIRAMYRKGVSKPQTILKSLQQMGIKKPDGSPLDMPFLSSFKSRNKISARTYRKKKPATVQPELPSIDYDFVQVVPDEIPKSIIAILEDKAIPGVKKGKIVQAYFSDGA